MGYYITAKYLGVDKPIDKSISEDFFGLISDLIDPDESYQYYWSLSYKTTYYQIGEMVIIERKHFIGMKLDILKRIKGTMYGHQILNNLKNKLNEFISSKI